MKFPVIFPLTAVAALVGAVVLALPAQAGMDGARGAPSVSYNAAHVAQSENSNRSEGSQAVWHGRSLADWTQAFWRWTLSIPLNVNAAKDTTGTHCGLNQAGPVWFLAAPVGRVFNLTCTVPAGKAILMPVAAYLNDYPCPYPFEPAPGQSLRDFLGGGAAQIIESYSIVEAQLDGQRLAPRRITTKIFPFSAAADLKPIDSCLTGSPQIGLSDGFFVTIDPLPRGDHILQVRSVSGILGMTEGTFTLKVR